MKYTFLFKVALIGLVLIVLISNLGLSDELMVKGDSEDCNDTSGGPYCTIAAALVDAGPGDEIDVYPSSAGYGRFEVESGDLHIAGITEGEEIPKITSDVEPSSIHDDLIYYNSVEEGVVVDLLLDSSDGDGIEFYSTEYVTVQDTEINSSAENGIFLDYSNRNIIYGVMVQDSGEHGIKLALSERNYIAGVKLKDNTKDGIHLLNSWKTGIGDSIISNNGEDGVGIKESEGNAILKNTVSNNDKNGIGVDESSENKIQGNTIYENSEHGIYIYESSYNTLDNNEIFDNTSDGVYLKYSDDNKIKNNTVAGNAKGINLASSNNYNTISGNTVKDNEEDGVIINLWSNYNKLLDNNIYGNEEHGIYLLDSAGHEVTSNVIYDNLDGMHISYSAKNYISGNVFKENRNDGIDLFGSAASDNVITRNDIVDNEDEGIESDYVEKLEITFNNVTGNASTGIDLDDVEYIEILGNRVTGNGGPGLKVTGDSRNVDATLNWWGDASGPNVSAYGYHGDGQEIVVEGEASVPFSPWLGSDPDGDLDEPGVQLTSPVTVVVDDIGPKPSLGTWDPGYLNRAIAGTNYVDVPAKVLVKHGTYELTEELQGEITLVSETGSTPNTFINNESSGSEITIAGPNVTIGTRSGYVPRGFTIGEEVTVRTGVDASTIALNWNDLQSPVHNDGDGRLDAEFNWWGDLDPSDQITGDVDYRPFLPEEPEKVLGYMEENGLESPRAAIAGRLIESGSSSEKLVSRMIVSFGVKPGEAEDILDEYGNYDVRLAFRESRGDYESFLGALG